jgi:hypothetical protein
MKKISRVLFACTLIFSFLMVGYTVSASEDVKLPFEYNESIGFMHAPLDGSSFDFDQFNYSQEFIEAELQRQIDEHLDRLQLRERSRNEYQTIMTRRNIQFVRVRAGGQGRDGTPAHFYVWTDGGNPVSANISLSWGLTSISVSSGNTNTSGSTGFGWTVPSHLHGFRTHLYVTRRIEVSEFEVWSRPFESGEPWRMSSRFSTSVPTGIEAFDAVIAR